MDAGGTWVRILAHDGRRRVAAIRLPASRAPDLAVCLRQLWHGRGWTARQVAALVVGARGVWTPRERRALARRLERLARRVRVLSDAELAFLGALGERPGVLVVAGTGAIVLGRDARGRWARAGGLGPLLGDDGSAFWIGRAWLRARSRETDGLAARRLATAVAPVARIAALAPRVAARAAGGDATARAILGEAQARLAAMAADVAARLRLPSPVAVGSAGGVMAGAAFRRGVRRALARTGVVARWAPRAASPVEAAARLAARIAAQAAPRRDVRRGAAPAGRRPSRRADR